MPQYPGVAARNENKCRVLTHGTKMGDISNVQRRRFVYCSPGSWLVASGYSGETFSTFPRLSEERGEAEAELRLGPGGAFVINCSRAGTGRGEDWIYNIKHRPGAECRDGVLVTAPLIIETFCPLSTGIPGPYFQLVY